MSQTVNTAFVQQFTNDLELMVQQRGSVILPLVNVKHITGKYTHFERLGAGEASEILSRHGDTPEPLNLLHSRRTLILRSFDASEMLDKADEVRMLLDPTNEYSTSLSYSLGRKADDIILAALYGNATATDSADAQSSVSFDSNNVIDEDIGTANSSLIVAKLRAAKKRFLVNNVDLQAETPTLLHSGTDLTDGLLTETATTSTDYNTVKALVNGEINTFMGFNFRWCERLEQAQHKTSEGFVRALVFVPSGIGIAMARNINAKISERNDKRHSTQIYTSMDIGAVRRQEEKVVSIECYR